MNFGEDDVNSGWGNNMGGGGGRGRGRGGFRGRGRGRGGGQRFHSGGEPQPNSDPQYTANVRIMLHNSAAGTIIGKGGEKINEIIRESGCSNIKCVGEKMPERVVLIHGEMDQAVKASAMMAEAIHAQYSYGRNRPPVIMARGQKQAGKDDVQFGLLLSEENCGPIIGKSGSRITTYVQETGCQVYVHNEYCSGKTLPMSNEKVVTITGPPTAIPVCMEKIFNILKEEGRGGNKRRIWDIYQTGPCNFFGDLGPNFGGGMPPAMGPAATGPIPGAWNAELPPGISPIIQQIAFSFNQAEDCWMGQVNQEMVTSIIGPRGARIKEMRAMTQCDIIIDDECAHDSVFRIVKVKKGGLEEGPENAKWLMNICINAFCNPELSLRPFSADMRIEDAILTGVYGAPPSLDEAGQKSFLEQCKQRENQNQPPPMTPPPQQQGGNFGGPPGGNQGGAFYGSPPAGNGFGGPSNFPSQW